MKARKIQHQGDKQNMKIILSRKGFDSSAGGYPSPYFVEDGRLLTFPIPEDNQENITDTGITYEDLKFDDKTYYDLMKDLGIKNFEKRYVHLDPDINHSVLSERHNEWCGLFGQCSSSQSHMEKHKVSVGDIFLFFGWFRDVEKTANGCRYISGTDKHIIWGYMQVGKIESIQQKEKYEDWKSNHPHYYIRNRNKNTAYIASDNLNFDVNKKGYGLLNFKKELILTLEEQSKRSVWKLPKYFHPDFKTKVSYHENIFDKGNNPVWESLDENHCILNSVGRGQEFVISGNDEVINWAKNLILLNENKQY